MLYMTESCYETHFCTADHQSIRRGLTVFSFSGKFEGNSSCCFKVLTSCLGSADSN